MGKKKDDLMLSYIAGILTGMVLIIPAGYIYARAQNRLRDNANKHSKPHSHA